MTFLWLQTAGGLFGPVAALVVSISIHILAGVFIGLFILGSIPPVVQALIIDPNKNRPKPDPGEPPPKFPPHYEASRAGVFTPLRPGEAKMIETWNGSFIRGAMNYPERRWAGEPDDIPLTPLHQAYWGVEKSGTYPDSHPLPFPQPKRRGNTLEWLLWVLYSPVSVTWWLWKRYVFRITGALWVGIPGYRTLHMYKMVRRKIRREEREVTENGATRTVTKTILEPYWDWSDHFRVKDYQFPVLVPRADTQNFVELEVQLNVIGQVVNPFATAYNTDDWPVRQDGAAINGVTLFSRPRPADEVIAAKDKDTKVAGEFAEAIKTTVSEKLEPAGIVIKEVQMLDATPTDRQMAIALGAPAKAKSQKEADELLAKGHAAPVREIGQAMRDFPEALHIPALEAMVRTAEKAGDKAIISLGGATEGFKPPDIAQIQQLRELNARLNPPGDATP